ncbi:MAG: hypothetical protein WCC65_11645 [Pseudonocardiaceae bacterium]
MLVGGCGDTVRGDPGQPVGVRVAGLSVINAGWVPASGSSTFDATPALRQSMGPMAPICKITAVPLAGIADPVQGLIASAVAPLGKGPGGALPLPGLTPPAAPGAPASPPPAAPADQPQAAPAMAPALASPAAGPFFGPMMPSDFPFALGRYNSGLPRYNYAELLAIGKPGATAGGLGRLSAGMLTADLFGTPQVSNGSSLGKQSAAANDVAAAGRATALPASGVERIALPILVAVLMLASVTAALLRGWVLGRR